MAPVVLFLLAYFVFMLTEFRRLWREPFRVREMLARVWPWSDRALTAFVRSGPAAYLGVGGFVGSGVVIVLDEWGAIPPIIAEVVILLTAALWLAGMIADVTVFLWGRPKILIPPSMRSDVGLPQKDKSHERHGGNG